jgi:hypothetical protein
MVTTDKTNNATWIPLAAGKKSRRRIAEVGLDFALPMCYKRVPLANGCDPGRSGDFVLWELRLWLLDLGFWSWDFGETLGPPPKAGTLAGPRGAGSPRPPLLLIPRRTAEAPRRSRQCVGVVCELSVSSPGRTLPRWSSVVPADGLRARCPPWLP